MHTRRERFQYYIRRARNRLLSENVDALKRYLQSWWRAVKHWRHACPECGARTRVFERAYGTRECTGCGAITVPEEEQELRDREPLTVNPTVRGHLAPATVNRPHRVLPPSTCPTCSLRLSSRAFTRNSTTPRPATPSPSRLRTGGRSAST